MEFVRTKKSTLSMDMAPLIDIIFQLLIFFMLSSSFLNPMIRLDLPKAIQSDSQETESLVLSIDAEKQLFLNGNPIKSENLQSAIAAGIEKTEKSSIHLKADQMVDYGYFIQVMDEARQAGASQINLVHQGEMP